MSDTTEKRPQKEADSKVTTDSHKNQSLSKVQGRQQDGIEEVPKAEKTVEAQRSGHSASGAPAVRLDMDLDVDIQMKAKIQGDLELSILGGDPKGS